MPDWVTRPTVQLSGCPEYDRPSSSPSGPWAPVPAAWVSGSSIPLTRPHYGLASQAGPPVRERHRRGDPRADRTAPCLSVRPRTGYGTAPRRPAWEPGSNSADQREGFVGRMWRWCGDAWSAEPGNGRPGEPGDG